MIRHGATAVLVAAGTASAGDSSHSITVAIITAVGGVAALIVGPLVTDRLRRHTREDKTEIALSKQISDMYQHDLARKDHELAAQDKEITDLKKEIDNLRRRR